MFQYNYITDFLFHRLYVNRRETVDALGAGALPAPTAGTLDLYRVLQLTVRTVPIRVGRAHQHHGRNGKPRRQMHWPRIAANCKLCAAKHGGKLLQRRLSDNLNRRDNRLFLYLGGDAFVHYPAPDQNGNDFLVVQPIRKHRVGSRRPSLVRPVRPDGQDRVIRALRYAGFGKYNAGNLLVPFRHHKWKFNRIYAAADGPRHVQISLHNMPVRMRSPDRSADLIAHFPHITGTEATRCAGKERNCRRLPKPLQVQRNAEPSRFELRPQRAEMLSESAERFEFLLLKQQNLVDVRIIHQQLPRRRLYRPSHPRLWERLLDGVRHG